MERGSNRPHISATSVQAGLLALTAQLSFSSISAQIEIVSKSVVHHVETLVQPRGLSPALLSPAPKHATRLCPKRISQSSRAAVGFGGCMYKYNHVHILYTYAII